MENVIQSENWFTTKQIETFVGEGLTKDNVMVGERRKLIILHQNGDDKVALIKQLETMIYNIETNGEAFAC